MSVDNGWTFIRFNRLIFNEKPVLHLTGRPWSAPMSVTEGKLLVGGGIVSCFGGVCETRTLQHVDDTKTVFTGNPSHTLKSYLSPSFQGFSISLFLPRVLKSLLVSAPNLWEHPPGTYCHVVRLPNPFSVDKVFLTIVSLVCPNPFRAENILQWSCRPFRLLVLHSWHFILSQAPLKISLTPLEAEISAQLLFNMAAACLVKAL